MKEPLKIRPYARLITMLGDQLIKNEMIALVELIKNSYDADASWVKVIFSNFGEDFSVMPSSKILIIDDGCGMDEEILTTHWLNPATPDKQKRKKSDNNTQKGRVLQGEKGIGRFAVFKLGSTIRIITRRQLKDDNGDFIEAGAPIENVLLYDFSKYDEEFLKENGKEKELFLDELEVHLSQRTPKRIVEKEMRLGATTVMRSPHGTIIEISNLKAKWTQARLDRVQNEVGKIQPIFSKNKLSDFGVWIYKDQSYCETKESYKEKLDTLLNKKAVFKITNGKFDSVNQSFEFNMNGEKCYLDFTDPDISGLTQFKKYFEEERRPYPAKFIEKSVPNLKYQIDCGSFEFEFYIFDLNIDSENPSKFMLDKHEKRDIKEHRIYLYRDGIRVMPYGDPDDDWLGIDIIRGTIRADTVLSNDQVVGCVYISQKENPNLKDKTNREGLIEEGFALKDFISVIQLVLRYVRKKPYAQYLVQKKKKKEHDMLKKGRPAELIQSARKQYFNDKDIQEFLDKFEAKYKKENQILFERITKTENLAAVGLSIETASHDVMLFIRKTLDQLDALVKEIMSGSILDREELESRLVLARGNLSMVETQMRDVQLLFPSTKTRTKRINVKDVIDKVLRLYQRQFRDFEIEVTIEELGSPVVAKTTDAVLLQVFINLFDNASYWLSTVNRKRKILVLIDGNYQRILFSDSGPGIQQDDEAYIFEAFYSGKGEEGRGLGLYIARQLLDRYDYTIELAEKKSDKQLEGANFVLEFVKEGP